MNRDQLLAQRADLLAQAKTALEKGDTKTAGELANQVKEIDEKISAYDEAQANLQALQGNPLSNLTPNNLGALGANDGGLQANGMAFGTLMEEEDDLFNTLEYRTAFMNYVTKGTEIPAKFTNADENTLTTDVGSVIPTTVLETIIGKLEATGMILSRVTRTSIKGGVTIPTDMIKPVATWVEEGKGSDKQKVATGSITFAYHKLRCAVSVSLEVDTIALPIFEGRLVDSVVNAMVKALEQGIISGDGVKKIKGILEETPNDGQEIEADGTIADLEKAEAALPLEHENGAVWCMTKKTFMHYASLKDKNDQPIGRVNYGGINDRTERTILGRPVVLNNYMDSIDKAEAGDVYAFLYDLEEFILNTNYQLTIKKYEDHDTDDQVTKAIMLVDGKVADKGSLVTLKKA